MKRVVCMIFIVIVWLGLPLFSEQEEAWENEQPVLKEAGGIWYVYMDFKGPYSLITEKSKVFVEEFKKQGLERKSDFLVAYYNSPRINKPEALEWACALAIDKDAGVEPPLNKKEFIKVQSVVIMHRGPIEKIQVSNDKVKEYIDKNGFEMVWPAYEVFHNDGVEIIHPVVKK